MSKRLELIEKMIAGGSVDPFHWYARAMELRSLGRLEDAMGAFDDVRSKFPDYVPTYLMAGQVAVQLGDAARAKTWLSGGVTVATARGESHALSELRAALGALDA
ncbi:MAG: tetratricopeptide repeat protein [Polyangiales bacterium]